MILSMNPAKAYAISVSESYFGSGPIRSMTMLDNGVILGGRSSGSQIEVWASSDKGNSWSRIGSVASNSNISYGDVMFLAVPQTKVVYCTFREKNNTTNKYAVTVCRSDDGGYNWVYDSTVISGCTQFVGAPWLFIAQNGDMQCYYDSEPLAAQNGVSGAQWIAMQGRNGLTGSWDKYGVVAASRDADASKFIRDGMATAVDLGNNRIMLVTEGIEDSPSGGAYANVVRAIQSFDGGRTWNYSGRKIVYQSRTDAGSGRRYNAYCPMAVRIGNGPVGVVFCTDEDFGGTPDASNAAVSSRRTHIKYIRTLDNFETWGSLESVWTDGSGAYAPGMIETASNEVLISIDHFGGKQRFYQMNALGKNDDIDGTVKIPGTENVLYSNTFISGNDLQYYPGVTASAPKYENNTLIISGGNSNKIFVSDKNYTDFVVEADIKVLQDSSKNSNQGGIIFRASNPYGGVSDGYDGYYFGIDALKKEAILGKVHGNQWTEIAKKKMTVDYDKYYHLAVAVSGNEITCYVNYNGANYAKIYAVDDDFSSGSVGFRHWLAPASFKNLTVSGYTPKSAANGYVNDVLASCADPDVLYYNGVYYLYSTNSADSGKGFKVYSSTDLANWTDRGWALLKENVYGEAGFWAPDLIEKDGIFYMYYVADEHLSVATSTSPTGPFTQTAAQQVPMHTDTKEIDAHVFKDDDGQYYIYFVRFYDGNGKAGGNHIWGARLNPDMRTIDESTLSCLISPTEGWETDKAAVAEGPFMLKKDGVYYLTYSGSHFQSNSYGSGYATSSSPLGTYTKYANNPIMQSNSMVHGAGHHCIVESPDGSEMFMVYHRHKDLTTTEPRTLCIDRMHFVKDDAGNTVLEVAGPTLTKQALPSGYDKREPLSNIEGKNMFFLGSSVTYGFASGGVSFVEYIAQRNNCTYEKQAVSGTTLVDNGSSSYVQRMLKNFNTAEKCDHFICQLSTNDATQNKPLGQMSNSYNLNDFDTSTVIGAMEYIIAYAKDTCNCPVTFYTNPYFNNANYQAMVDALYRLKEKWDVGVIDLWNNEDMRNVSSSELARYMADSIHPTAAGYEEWWTPVFEEYLQKYDYSAYTGADNTVKLPEQGRVLYDNKFMSAKGLTYYPGLSASIPVYDNNALIIKGGNSNKISADGLSYTDFVLEADVKVSEDASKNSNQGGLIFRVTDPVSGVSDGYNGYYFGIDVLCNEVLLGKVRGNQWIEIAREKLTLEYDTYYHLTVAVSGDKIMGYVNYDGTNSAVITASDSEFISGSVGFRHWLAPSAFKNLRVSEYVSKESETTEAPKPSEAPTETPEPTEEPKTTEAQMPTEEPTKEPVDACPTVHIEAEDFASQAGVGISGTIYENSQVVNGIGKGDSMTYNVTLQGTGNYRVDVRAARQYVGVSVLEVYVDGMLATTVDISSTGLWKNFATFSSEDIYLTNGTHEVTLKAAAGGYNINWFEFVGSAPVEDTTVSGEDADAKLHIEAEDYENDAAVGISATKDQDSAVVNGVDKNDAMVYTVNIPVSGSYTFSIRASRVDAAAGTISIRENGKILGKAEIGKTGAWSKFEEFTGDSFCLSAGTHTLTLYADSGRYNLNWFELEHKAGGEPSPETTEAPKTTEGSQDPSSNNIHIEAEDYVKMSGVSFSAKKDKDSAVVNSVDAGDYMDYTVKVPVTGTYRFDVRASRQYAGSSVLSLMENGSIIAKCSVGSTGSWSVYKEFTGEEVHLTAGTHTLRVYATGGKYNLNWYELRIIKAEEEKTEQETFIGDDNEIPFG